MKKKHIVNEYDIFIDDVPQYHCGATPEIVKAFVDLGCNPYGNVHMEQINPIDGINWKEIFAYENVFYYKDLYEIISVFAFPQELYIILDNKKHEHLFNGQRFTFDECIIKLKELIEKNASKI